MYPLTSTSPAVTVAVTAAVTVAVTEAVSLSEVILPE